MKQPRARLLVFNDPHPMRVEKELAAEIGLNESILFLQIEFLISISRHEHDGRLWTYQSLQDLHDNYFPWWSLMTISRIIKALEKRELLIVGNYNKSGFDRTQWFALNEEGINKLQSVKLQPAPIYQNDKRVSQNDEIESNNLINRSSQIDTTIPETTTETTQRGGDTRERQNTAAAETTRLSAEQREYVDRLMSEQMLMRDQATKAAALDCMTGDALDRLQVWRSQMVERNLHLPQHKQKKPQAILAACLKQGCLPDDLPPPPPREMTEAEKEARYLAEFYSRTVHPADYRR